MSGTGLRLRMNQQEGAELVEQRVEQLLQVRYGLAGELKRLPGENLNYLVSTSDGNRYVLKLASDGRGDGIIDMEHRATEHVAERGIGICLPRTVPTLDGGIVAVFGCGSYPPLRGRLLEFVAGTAWDKLDRHGQGMLADLGQKLARLDLALAAFEHPAAHRSHGWNLAELDQHRAKTALVEDRGRRRMLEWMFQLWVAQVKPELPKLPVSFIHGDANDENLLTDGIKVTGLLDFGDGLCNPVVCELAITLAYAMLDREDPLAAAAAVTAAYHAVRPLCKSELRVLFSLICGRLANSVAVAAQRRRVEPDHVNWFVTEDRAWRLLEKLYAVNPADAGRLLAAAAGVDAATDAGVPVRELLAQRRVHIGPSLSIAYREPLKMKRGRAQFLFDHTGRPYLDLVNNICHVGHCHPRVVAAGQRQMAILNTNTRYLYEGLTEYAQRLCATLPDPLSTCFFVNSGSEANELALRLARAHTGREDFLVVDSAYHGNTGRLISISPYKFMGPGGTHKVEPWVHLVPTADGYRGLFKGQDSASGRAYGDEVGGVINGVDPPIAGFITETIWSCGGQVVPPQAYLNTAFNHVREAGGVCIVDEVQVGFGRVGKCFWGFQLQEVVPDIVVMGKPMGNGHPMAAVVTTLEIARSFDNGMEFFSSFGGNPVSCAIGLAVLDVIAEESLQDHARILGEHFKAGLQRLAGVHPIIGDVRGEGLFLGAELVQDRQTLTPATAAASVVVNQMKQRGILISTDGPFDNVLKIKPPMVITEADVDMVLRCLDDVLAEVGAGP